MKYKCDHCDAIFTDDEVVLKDFGNNFRLIGQVILVKNKNTGKIFRTFTDQIVEGDCSLHCPKCDSVHLFGFNCAPEEAKVAV